MIRPSIYATLRNSGKDAKALVQLVCYFNNKTKHYVRISSGLKINPEDWINQVKSPTPEFAINNPEWFAELNEKKEKLNKAFELAFQALGKSVNAKAVQDVYESSRTKRSNGSADNVTTLIDFIRWYIEKQDRTPFSKRKSKGTLKNYIKILNRLERYYIATKTHVYLKTVTMDDIDTCVAWFERQKYSNGMLYAQNTIRDHEKWLIAMVNKAVANRFECQLWNPRHGEGRVSTAETDDVHFVIDDLQKLLNYILQNALETNALVWGVIGYCTGLRHGDWERCYELLTHGSTDFGEYSADIEVASKRYRFLHMCPSKTRNHVDGKGIWCGIPILKPVEEMIKRHGLPKPLVNQLMNRNLKEIAISAGIDEQYAKHTKIAGGKIRVEIAMKGDFVSTHKIGRTSFITQFAEFIPKPILVKITAHVGGSRDAFDGYVKDQNLKRNAERFISILKDHQDRGEFGDFRFV